MKKHKASYISTCDRNHNLLLDYLNAQDISVKPKRSDGRFCGTVRTTCHGDYELNTYHDNKANIIYFNKKMVSE